MNYILEMIPFNDSPFATTLSQLKKVNDQSTQALSLTWVLEYCTTIFIDFSFNNNPLSTWPNELSISL